MLPLELLEKIRYELSEINSRILRNNYIKSLNELKFSINAIKLFVEQQYYIATNDAKAIAIMYSRTDYPDNIFFFKLLEGHQVALERLDKLLKYFNIDKEKIFPLPSVVAYTHFLLKLALHHTIQEQIFSILINFPIFIENINKMGKILKEKYNLEELSFFVDAVWEKEIEFLGLKILEKYDLNFEKILKVVKMIQEYELMYWENLNQEAMKLSL